MSDTFSHIDDQNRPTMVDVSNKLPSLRAAEAQCEIWLPQELRDQFSRQSEINSPKGPVLATAIIAGTMAAKKTSDLIPFCHPLPLENCQIKIRLTSAELLLVICKVSTTHKTGVEMEALTGASGAALTIYDMCKALSHRIEIRGTKLVAKSGGKRDFGRFSF